jgi:hypothetical protein
VNAMGTRPNRELPHEPLRAERYRPPTPQTTIEAVMYCVRERGVAALLEPANQQRLLTCDAAARAEINTRIAKLEDVGRMKKSF